MASFHYDPAITERFPSIVGGVIRAVDLVNPPASDELTDAFRVEQAAAIARIGETPLSEVPSLAAWRRTFRGFGVDPTAYRSASEALLRRLTKQGSIPSINTVVDLGNLVSIRYALPVAVFDQGSMTGATTVRFAKGTERFVDLGSGTDDAPESGEVIFIDEAGLVAARRWCWRQGAATASGPATTEVLVTVEGHHDAAPDDVAAALADLETLLAIHARPSSMRSAIVDGSSPAFPPATGQSGG